MCLTCSNKSSLLKLLTTVRNTVSFAAIFSGGKGMLAECTSLSTARKVFVQHWRLSVFQTGSSNTETPNCLKTTEEKKKKQKVM